VLGAANVFNIAVVHKGTYER